MIKTVLHAGVHSAGGMILYCGGCTMFFEESFETRPSDYDSRGRLSLEAILNILETSGGHHTEAVKDRV